MVPIAEIFATDISLEARNPADSFTSCPGGIHPDTDTDVLGQTTFSSMPKAGGSTQQVHVAVFGIPLPPCFDLAIVSSDLNGDFDVDPEDIAQWAIEAIADWGLGNISFRADLYPDGKFNMLDFALYMRHWQEVCP